MMTHGCSLIHLIACKSLKLKIWGNLAKGKWRPVMAHSLTSIVAIAFLQYYLASHNILKLHQRETRCLPSLPLIIYSFGVVLLESAFNQHWKSLEDIGSYTSTSKSPSLSPQGISSPSTTKRGNR